MHDMGVRRGVIHRAAGPAVAFFALCALATIAIGLYMARPWGGNEAYQSLRGYLLLAGMLLWAVSPLVGLWSGVVRFRHAGAAGAVFALGAAMTAGIGLAAYVDVAFVHPGAQGGIAFVFVPGVQWVAAVLLALVCLLLRHRAARRS